MEEKEMNSLYFLSLFCRLSAAGRRHAVRVISSLRISKVLACGLWNTRSHRVTRIECHACRQNGKQNTSSNMSMNKSMCMRVCAERLATGEPPACHQWRCEIAADAQRDTQCGDSNARGAGQCERRCEAAGRVFSIRDAVCRRSTVLEVIRRGMNSRTLKFEKLNRIRAISG